MSFRTLAAKFLETVKDDLGIPARLRRVIAEQPALRRRVDDTASVIALSSVVRWHEWSHRIGFGHGSESSGEVRGWRSANGRYQGEHRHIPALARLSRRETTADFACDITDVSGLSASKSELYRFNSMQQMAEQACQAFTQDLSQEGLAQNLRWPEVRIVHGGSDFMVRHDWDDGLYLVNSGGSHHFVAAQHIARHLQQPVALQGRLERYGLDADAVAQLNDEYAIYAVAKDAYFSDALDALRDFKATHFWGDLPHPYDNGLAIFLPKEEPRSRKVAEVFASEGFTNVGEILVELASENAAVQRRDRQDEMRKRIEALPGLEAKAGVAHVFGKHAAASLRHELATQVDWPAVERATLEEAFGVHRLDAQSVFEGLCQHSPGAVSRHSQNTLRATVDGYAALHERQLDSQATPDAPSPD
ncbi:DUF6685 family protein [Pseudomonas sp. SWRI77]|jgi:hypothetical protein|uniref:DUF6685 family protein n=1 Tax=Pseudomonas sp. SWRI77 TaxID=2745485 RepID=UPI0016452BEA|nr:DUF6685 family protein [Pseudomonas sp. SWRI77]MBC3479056.1 hypothetical protein [Pseudomonas sp. SWRI77]